MSWRKIATILLAAALGLGPCAAAAEAETPAVRVGDFGYTVANVQGYYNAIAQQFVDAGETVEADTADALRDMVIDGYVDLGVCEMKLRELGLVPLTNDQQTELDAYVDEYFAQITAAYEAEIVKAYDVDEAQAKESAPAMMALSGITRDAVYEQQASLYRNQLLLDYITKDMAFTDEQIAARYDYLFVAEQREKYQNDFAAFESEVMATGSSSYYLPAGLRAVERLVLAVPDEYANALTLPEGAELDAALAGIADHYAEALALFAAAAKANENFDSLLEQYPAVTLDSGYAIHEKSTLWDEDLKRIALALQAPGDMSGVVRQGGEICVVCYRSLLPEGAAKFAGEDQEQLDEYALNSLRVDALDAQVEQWKAEYQIETHPELLTTPEALQ